MPYYSEELAARARNYVDTMYRNLDRHLGRVIDALEDTGRPWNIVLTTDHGFEPQWREFIPNRVLLNAGLLALDERGNVDPSRTRAFYAGNGAIRINVAGRYRGGIVAPEEYDAVVEEVSEAFYAVRDPRTGERIVAAVHRASTMEGEGLGGRHGADLYLEIIQRSGYYFGSSRVGGTAIVEDGERLAAGFHGSRPSNNELQQGFAVLGGTNFADGVVVDRARSIDLTPTAAYAVGIRAAAHWIGTVYAYWTERPGVEEAPRSEEGT